MLKLDLTGSVPELYLYGVIAKSAWWNDGDTVSSAGVLELLDRIDPGSELIVRINSEGGDVFEGVAIYNALARRQARLQVEIDALAASIASVIAMAGDEIVIAGNAMVMIHSAWTFAEGNADDMAKIAETLRQVDETILNTYEARAGKKSTRDQIVAWVKAETWMGPAEAIERGFADRAGDLKSGVDAAVPAGRFKNTPSQLLESRESRAERRDPERMRTRSLSLIAARIRDARRKVRRGVG
jgi:ATP-dependent Clp protease protease subunit